MIITEEIQVKLDEVKEFVEQQLSDYSAWEWHYEITQNKENYMELTYTIISTYQDAEYELIIRVDDTTDTPYMEENSDNGSTTRLEADEFWRLLFFKAENQLLRRKD